jgi:hypothetical protein
MSGHNQDLAIIIDEQPPPTGNPLDIPTPLFKTNLERRRENRTLLLDWIRFALKEGTDYGSIPTKRGPSKPSLFKPGAEKICGMLGVTVRFPSLAETEQALLKGFVPEYVMVRCELSNIHGQTLADGVGARSLKQDYGDLNKALKMAEKSAHIDATLRLAGLSEVFTQDTEDMTNLKKVNLQLFKLDQQRFIAYCNKIASAKSLGSIRSLNELPVALFDYVMKKLPELATAA